MNINKPSMGWNTWNTFGANINEKLVLEMADVMVSEGYLDAGYDTLVIDDAWQMDKRSDDGHIQVDKEKFPNGIKAVADYVHSKGLKFGLYSAAGVRTCCDKPGSFGYEYVDAQDFADWGVDYIKYDLCHFPGAGDRKVAYLTMGMALKATGRDIVYSAAICGEAEPGTWLRSVGAHNFRMSGDILDTFGSIKFIADKMDKESHLTASGSYGDMDMLVVGMRGEGYAAKGGCSWEEYYTHFALWCFYNSPLMIGADLRKISEEDKKILLDKNLIAINQDIENRFPFRERTGRYAVIQPDKYPLIKLLSDNKFAIGLFNMQEHEDTVNVYLPDFGISASSGKKLKITDIRTGESKVVRDAFNYKLQPHACRVYLAEIVD